MSNLPALALGLLISESIHVYFCENQLVPKCQVGIVGMVSHLVSILDAGEGGKEDGQKGEQLQDVEDEKA